MSSAPVTHVNRPPRRIAKFRARTLQKPLAESVVDGILVRLWMLAPEVLAHESHACVEQVERRAKRVAHRLHTWIIGWSALLAVRRLQP